MTINKEITDKIIRWMQYVALLFLFLFFLVWAFWSRVEWLLTIAWCVWLFEICLGNFVDWRIAKQKNSPREKREFIWLIIMTSLASFAMIYHFFK